MRKFSAKYHEMMFYFWYGKNAALRDYHGKKYHQILSLPVSCVSCGLEFRSIKRDAAMVLQGISAVGCFTLVMLALVAQFA